MTTSQLMKALSIAGLALLIVAGGVFWITHQGDTARNSDQREHATESTDSPKSLAESTDLAQPKSPLGTCSINTPCESPTPAITALSAAKSEDQHNSAIAFHELLVTVSTELPTLQNLAQLKSEEAHRASRIEQMIQTAREQLAPVDESIRRDLSLAAAGHQFYVECFRRGDLPFEIRALCLRDARLLNEKPLANGTTSPPENVTGLPQEIITLADHLSLK